MCHRARRRGAMAAGVSAQAVRVSRARGGARRVISCVRGLLGRKGGGSMVRTRQDFGLRAR